MGVCMGKTIREWQTEVHRLARTKGWYDDEPADDVGHRHWVAARLAMVHSEISEALEALRDGDIRQATLMGKPEGFGIELADAVIRILDLAESLGLDIEEAMTIKHAYNATRPPRHGGKAL